MSVSEPQAAQSPVAKPKKRLTPHQKRQRQRIIRATAAVVFALVLWQVFVDVGFVNPLFAASPLGIIKAFGILAQGGQFNFLTQIDASATEFAWGFSIGVVTGVIGGVLVGWFPFFDDISDFFVGFLYATPYIAFLPVIILWFGIGLLSKVIIIFWATFFPVLINTTAGVKNTPPEFLRVARSFYISPIKTLSGVVLPASVPYILAGLRQGIGRALVGVIVAEFYIASRGVGFFISETTSAFEMNQAFAAIFIVGITGVILVRVVAALEHRVANWTSDVA